MGLSLGRLRRQGDGEDLDLDVQRPAGQGVVQIDLYPVPRDRQHQAREFLPARGIEGDDLARCRVLIPGEVRQGQPVDGAGVMGAVEVVTLGDEPGPLAGGQPQEQDLQAGGQGAVPQGQFERRPVASGQGQGAIGEADLQVQDTGAAATDGGSGRVAG